MDGGIHTIRHGREFTCGINQMRNYLYQKATDKNCNVRVFLKNRSDGSRELEFQFLGVPRNEEDIFATMKEVAAARLAESVED
jgi:hypothetical protein